MIYRRVILIISLITSAAAFAHAQPLKFGGERRGSSNTEYSKVSVFGVEGTGNKFIYVFDRSSSMDGAPRAAAKRQLIKSIDTIHELQQFHVIFFNQRLLSLTIPGSRGRIAFATDRNKKQAVQFINRVKADGATDRFLALRHALAMRPDVIFFLSDADDPMTANEMARIAEINERIGAQICVIEYGQGDTPPKGNFLTELASSSSGKYVYVNAAKLQ
jgi:uncharacterized protein with von Willebrand factor type A (vWA) domain